MSCFYCLIIGLGFRRRHNKKQKNETVTITLTRNGETQEITLPMNKKYALIKLAKKLTNLNKQGWQLTDAKGNSKHTQFIKNIAHGHKPGPKEMLQNAGLPSMPKMLKRFWKKDEDSTKSL